MFAEKIFAIAHYADQVVLVVLIIMSIVSVGMIFERFMTLKKISEESMRTRLRIKLALQTNSLQDFEDLAKDPTSIEGRAAGQSMKHLKESGLKGFEEVFNTFILIEKPDLEKYLAVLATRASNAPFIGLLGTVLGIMKAFNDLAQATDAGQQTVMAGISVEVGSFAKSSKSCNEFVCNANLILKRVRILSSDIFFNVINLSKIIPTETTLMMIRTTKTTWSA